MPNNIMNQDINTNNIYPSKGEKGMPGNDGQRGARGQQGLSGHNGNKGDKGESGTQGISIIGEKGNHGDKGPKGNSGERGEKGNLGPTGPQTNLNSIINENITDTFSYINQDIRLITLFNSLNTIKLDAKSELYFDVVESTLKIGDIFKNSISQSNISKNYISLYSLYENNSNIELYNPDLLEKSTYYINNTNIINNKEIKLISKYIIDSKLESYQTIPDIHTGYTNLPNLPINGYFIQKIHDNIAYTGALSENSLNIHHGEIISDSYRLNSKKKSIGIALGSLNNNSKPELNINKLSGEFKYLKKSFMTTHTDNYKYIKERNSNLNNTIRGSKRLLALSSLDPSFSINNQPIYPFASGINNSKNYTNCFKTHMENIIKPGNIIRSALNFVEGFTNNSSAWKREMNLDSSQIYQLPFTLTDKIYNKKYNIINNITNYNWSKEKYGTSYFIPPGDPGSYFRNSLHPGFFNNSIIDQDCYGQNQMSWGVITQLLDFITIPSNYDTSTMELIGDYNKAKIDISNIDAINRNNYQIKEFVIVIIEIETLNHTREFEYWSPFLQKQGMYEPSTFLYGLPQYDVHKYAKNKYIYDTFKYNYNNYLDIINYRSLDSVVDSNNNVNWNVLWQYLENPLYDWNESYRNSKNLILDTLELCAHSTIIKTELSENFEKKKIHINTNIALDKLYIKSIELINANNNNIIDKSPCEEKYISKNDQFIDHITSTFEIKIKSDKNIPNLLSAGKNKNINDKKFILDSYSNITMAKNTYDITLKTDIENIKTNLSYNSTIQNFSLSVAPDKVIINSKLIGNENSNNLITSSNIIPDENSIYNFGKSDKYWDNIYVNNLHYKNLVINNNPNIHNHTSLGHSTINGNLTINGKIITSTIINELYIDKLNVNTIENNLKFNKNIDLHHNVDINSLSSDPNNRYTYNNILQNNHNGIIGTIPNDKQYDNVITKYSNDYLLNKTIKGTKLNSQSLNSISIISEIITSNNALFKNIVSKSNKSNLSIIEIKNDQDNTKYLQFINNCSLIPECTFRGKIKINNNSLKTAENYQCIFIDFDENISEHSLTSGTFEKHFIPFATDINNKVLNAENNITLLFNITGNAYDITQTSTKLWATFCNLNGKTTLKGTLIDTEKVGLQFTHIYNQTEINSNIWINWSIIAKRIDTTILSYSNIGGEKQILDSDIIFN